jgi:hypothetical protein
VQWTGADTRYAAATAGAFALVAYLIAGNFGLVPSPLTGLRRQPISVAVPALNFALTQAANAPAPSVPTAALDIVLPATPPPPPVPPPPPPQPDTTGPDTSFTTADGAVLSPLDEGGPAVTGSATDAGSGVAAVTVTFVPATGEPLVRSASLDCASPDARACDWRAASPEVPGTYTVTAQATDRVANVGPASQPITVAVVSAGAQDGSGGVIDSLLDTVGGLLGL